jgi:transcriptional antiterminator NusG
MMDHVPDSRGMTEDAPEAVEVVEELEGASPVTEAGVSVPASVETSEPEAQPDAVAEPETAAEAEAAPEPEAAPEADIAAGVEAAEEGAPPLEVEAMEEPVSEGVSVLDVAEEPPLAEVDEDEREAFGEVAREPEPVLEAPSGEEEAVPEPEPTAAPEPEMEGPGEDGAEAVDLIGQPEEAPEDQIPEEIPAEEETPAEAEHEPEAEADTVAEAEVEVVAAGRRDPFRGPGDWYVVHTYAGYENKVKANLESRIHSMQMEDKIFDVHIPMEDVMEIKGGKKQVVQRKVFPGYLLVKMTYDNDSWYVVRNTPGVTGFVSSGTGTKPTPLSRREVEKILSVKEEEVKPTFRLEFEEGDTVRIISGPFADFNGTISEINVDQSKLKVLVNIFDRETPVELGFDQVAKV